MQLPKINIPSKYLKIGAWILGSFLVLVAVAGSYAYTKREALLEKAINRAIKKAEKDYGLDVKIENAGFRGLSKVHMNAITIVPADRDTLSIINDLTVGVKLFPLIFGDVKLSEVTMNEGTIDIVFKDSLSNLDFLLKRKKKDSTQNSGKADLSEIAHNLLNQLLYKIPDDMKINDLSLRINDNDTANVKFLLTTATIDDGDLRSTIIVDNNSATWHVNGKVEPGRKQLDLLFFADGKKVELPYLENKLKVKLNFDTVHTVMSSAGYSGGDFKVTGSWAVKNLLFNHPKVASTNIVVPDARIDAEMLIGNNYIALDSTSTMYIKGASIHPYIKYTLSPSKIYELKLRAEEQDAQQVLDAFPQGLFESLEGMKVSGKVRYDLSFYLDTSIPDSLKFSSALTPANFKIIRWGKSNLQKINKEFIYTPYEYGKAMRNITVGPENPNFTPLSQISSNFKNAVLTAEDPSFMTHNGFIEESIRKSFVVNFKEKRFVRGGSTISMQLVKNVFLSRQKTLARKAEEILIVWLIENNNLVSKNRMLEVYCNVIEMGNNIYGIGEASRHYFGKSPSDLTIGEGIFLANIVPRPKIAMYKFRADGGLKDYLYPYFKFLGNIMARRGLTPPDTSGYGFYSVQLREGLRQYLLPDTLTMDTTAFDDEDGMPIIQMQDKNKALFDRLFSTPTKDTISKPKIDTVPKTRKEIRQEKREQRRQEKEND